MGLPRAQLADHSLPTPKSWQVESKMSTHAPVHLSTPAVGKVKGQFLETVTCGSLLSWLSRHIRNAVCFPPQSIGFLTLLLSVLLLIPMHLLSAFTVSLPLCPVPPQIPVPFCLSTCSSSSRLHPSMSPTTHRSPGTS